MKTISICAGPRGDCRAGDVSAQCPLLERERGRVGREELQRAGEMRGWGKGLVPERTCFVHDSLLLEIIQMVPL